MLKINDKKFFLELVAERIAQNHLTSRNKRLRNRWIKAIAKGAAVILEGDLRFLHWDAQKQILYFWSADSNEIYETGETFCACPAFLQSLPCYHRAMSRLVKNYFEFQEKPGELSKIDFADAVFFDSELSVREKVNLLNASILEGRIELKTRVTALVQHISA